MSGRLDFRLATVRQDCAAARHQFAAMHALLYLLVTSERDALLAGALALFVLLLATVILLTRQIDGYSQKVTVGSTPR